MGLGVRKGLASALIPCGIRARCKDLSARNSHNPPNPERQQHNRKPKLLDQNVPSLTIMLTAAWLGRPTDTGALGRVSLPEIEPGVPIQP